MLCLGACTCRAHLSAPQSIAPCWQFGLFQCIACAWPRVPAHSDTLSNGRMFVMCGSVEMNCLWKNNKVRCIVCFMRCASPPAMTLCVSRDIIPAHHAPKMQCYCRRIHSRHLIMVYLYVLITHTLLSLPPCLLPFLPPCAPARPCCCLVVSLLVQASGGGGVVLTPCPRRTAIESIQPAIRCVSFLRIRRDLLTLPRFLCPRQTRVHESVIYL